MAIREVLSFIAEIAASTRGEPPSTRITTVPSSSSRDLPPIREEARRSRTPSLATDIEETACDEQEYVDVAERHSRPLEQAVREDDVDDDDTLDDTPPTTVLKYPDQQFGCYENAHPKGAWKVVLS